MRNFCRSVIPKTREMPPQLVLILMTISFHFFIHTVDHSNKVDTCGVISWSMAGNKSADSLTCVAHLKNFIGQTGVSIGLISTIARMICRYQRLESHGKVCSLPHHILRLSLSLCHGFLVYHGGPCYACSSPFVWGEGWWVPSIANKKRPNWHLTLLQPGD